jgi:hypothetical protein
MHNQLGFGRAADESMSSSYHHPELREPTFSASLPRGPLRDSMLPAAPIKITLVQLGVLYHVFYNGGDINAKRKQGEKRARSASLVRNEIHLQLVLARYWRFDFICPHLHGEELYVILLLLSLFN